MEKARVCVIYPEVKKISLAASCDATVLILGETGAGKELFAPAIYYLRKLLNASGPPAFAGRRFLPPGAHTRSIRSPPFFHGRQAASDIFRTI